jgi:hypothetical protein
MLMTGDGADGVMLGCHDCRIGRLVLLKDLVGTVGMEDGPVLAPFPLQLTSKVIPGSGYSRATVGMPTADLASIPEDTRLRLTGVYIGWGAITPSKDLNVQQSYS